ncbi:MAG: GPR endopeptidase [Firmicutes bacterium]|nr:GPR endopeptidase [Bacillota bacterium]
MKKISDLAVELCEDLDKSESGFSFDVENFENGVKKHITHIKSEMAAKDIGKPIGIYANIEVCNFHSLVSSKDNKLKALQNILSDTIIKFIRDSKVPFRKLLVVGLGNSRFVADSLGPKTCEMLNGDKYLATFAAGVAGVTGIESVIAIKAISKATSPSHVLVIDSLCCHEKERLGNNFQISNAGISPGSGVGRDNKKINQSFLGVPVIALGVPLVIYLPSLHYVVPKMVDLIVERCVQVIVGAVNDLQKSSLWLEINRYQ